MRKGKLKILSASVLLGLMLCVSILSGCSLVTTDYSAYYKAIVASATTENGKKIEITKKDLLIAYNSYGYQYASYYGMSAEEAVKTTLKGLVANELVIDKVERHLQEKNNGQILSEKEKTYLFEKTYDSLLSNLKETEEEIEDDEEEKTLTKEVKEKQATLSFDVETGKYIISKNQQLKSTIDAYVFWSNGNKDASTEAGKNEIYKMLGDFVVANPDYANAYSKYLSKLKAGEKGQGLSTANKDVFLREIERLYDVNYDSYLVTLYEEIYKSNATNVTANDILDLYKSNLLEDYTKYAIENTSKYSEDILSSAEGMYYIPQGQEFFYVTHILVKFTDEQTALLKEYQNTIEGNGSGKYTLKEAVAGVEDLYNGLQALVRTSDENGVYTEDENLSKKISANEVLTEVKTSLATNDTTKKAENFYDLMFKYTEDDATLNMTYNYVIGVDYSTPTKDEDGNVTKEYTAHSQMVETFTDAAIELYNHGEGKVGDYTSDFVRSEYGLHILMYGGKIENLCENVSLDMSLPEETIVTLDATRINQCVDYTYFDMLYSTLVSDNFAKYQEKDQEEMISKLKNYNFYYNAYKDLL